jgi:DNA-binding response OmpR family regulator
MGIVRTVFKRYILSELNDVAIEEADSAESGFEKIGKNRYDIVISANEMKGMSATDLFEKIKKNIDVKGTSFLVVTSPASTETIDILKQAGIKNIIKIPCSSKELVEVINDLTDQRQLRCYSRANIPGTQAILNTVNGSVSANVINFSPGGVLLELNDFKKYEDLFKKNEVVLSFSAEFENLKTTPIMFKMLRLNVLTFTHADNCVPACMRIVCQFVDISNDNKNMLEKIVEKAQKDWEHILKD